jgi:hypothetical protein
MNRSISWLVACAAAPVIALAVYSTEATAQTVVVEPTAAYVASYEPMYYNGMAHYWYRDRWFYRDHGAWRWYEHGREPGYLHDHFGEWGHHWHHWR